MNKKLLIILHGEARGLGTGYESAGSNMLDLILSNVGITDTFGTDIHVLWSLSDIKQSYETRWNVSYTVDRKGNEIACVDFLPRDEIIKNIDEFMSEYEGKCTHSYMWRDKIQQRFGKAFVNALEYSISNEYDWTILSRPDMNISTESVNQGTYINALEQPVESTPIVLLNQGPHVPIFDFNPETDDYTLTRRGYEIMMWNRPAMEMFYDILAVKAKQDWGSPTDPVGTNPFTPPWGLDGGETFWSLMMVVLICFWGSENIVKLGLPFRNRLREYDPEWNNPSIMHKGQNRHGILSIKQLGHEVVAKLDWAESYPQRNSADEFNAAIREFEDENDLRMYFVPEIPVRTIYEDFSEVDIQTESRCRLESLFLQNRLPEDGDSVLWNVSYGPDEYPPSLGYYYQIKLQPELINGQPTDIQNDGFMTTIFYGLYNWYNEFDFDHNKWNRPSCLYLNNDHRWLIHPGRARMRFQQFADTNSPMFLCLGTDIDLPDYTKNAIPLRDNLDEAYSAMLDASGYEKLEIRIRKYNNICDLQYTEYKNNQTFSGETYPLYYGKKLLVEYKKDVILFNSEPVARVEDGCIYFCKSLPKFKLKDR